MAEPEGSFLKPPWFAIPIEVRLLPIYLENDGVVRSHHRNNNVVNADKTP